MNILSDDVVVVGLNSWLCWVAVIVAVFEVTVYEGAEHKDRCKDS